MRHRTWSILGLLVTLMLEGCMSNPAANEPAWLRAALAPDQLGGIPESIVDVAAADPNHVAVLEGAAAAADAYRHKRLSHLAFQLFVFEDRRPEALVDLARTWAVRWPYEHTATLASIANRLGWQRAERELLPYAFVEIPASEPQKGQWRFGRAEAATSLVQQLVFNSGSTTFPRQPPLQTGWRVDASDPWCRCAQQALMALYGIGEPGEALAALELAVQKDKERLQDHEFNDMATVIDRLGGNVPPPP